MATEEYPNVTPFTMMPYDLGPTGVEMRKKHNFKLIKQEGNVVEYEFTFCDDKECSCHLERYQIVSEEF